jgi:thiamine biosynthesis protein ThiI
MGHRARVTAGVIESHPPVQGHGVVLARFGELGIKGPQTRRRFLRRLRENLEEALVARRVEAEVVEEWGRFFLHASNAHGAIDAITHTFGFVSASVAEEVPAEPSRMATAVAATARRVLAPGASFAMRVRRTGNHAFTSQTMARDLGSAVFEAVPGLRVDLERPDVEIFVEIRNSRAYVFRDTIPGPGGLPVGTQGRVLLWCSSVRDVAAAWFVLRRGCSVDLVRAPSDSGGAAERIDRAIAALRAFVPRLRVETDTRAPAEALNARVAHRKAIAVATGEGLAEMIARSARGRQDRPRGPHATLDETLPVPVLRPLVGMDDRGAAGTMNDIIKEWESLVGFSFTHEDPFGSRAEVPRLG